MELPVVSALEFEQLKSSIKTFIKTKTEFKDYNFEGSNLSMLVDILAYNTLYTSYNVSMAANELNLDTAVLRDNVVSIAKRLGYNPNSYTSARVNLTLTINDVQNYDSVRVERGSLLAASVSGQNFKFLLRDDLELNTAGKSTAVFPDVELLEGSEFSILYTVDTTNEHQRFFIPNNYIDSDSIRVFVITDPSTNVEEEYTRKNTIVDVSATSKIFFVEEVQDQKYEVVFGDDVFGRKLRDGEVIKIQYIISSGSQANSISIFDFVGSVYGRINNIENIIENSKVSYTINSEFSDGGSEFESIRSIKYAAPRYYASQERAVTVSDYESIIRQVYSNADLVKVVGGENLSPPRFGKILISIKPFVGESVSISEKNRIIRELNKYKVGSIDVEILDPTNISINANPVVIFDPSKTRNKQSDIVSLINDTFTNYSKSLSFNVFGGKYSDLDIRCMIKDLDPSIEFVSIPIFLSQLITLRGSVEDYYEVDFYTKLKTNGNDDYYILSDPFCVRGVASPVFLGARTGCESDNNIYMYYLNGNLIRPVGTVDNETGQLKFSLTSCIDTEINISVVPEITDIIFGPNIVPNLILQQPNTITSDGEDVLERTNILNTDTSVIPTGTILSQPATGDTTTLVSPTSSTLIPSVGGLLVVPPPVILEPISVEDDTPTITDPNNIGTIDNFTPELDPYSCS